jgi:putative transposase
MEVSMSKLRKRHIATDTGGLLLSVVSHTANKHESMAGFAVIETLKHRFPRLVKIFAYGGYPGQTHETKVSRFPFPA